METLKSLIITGIDILQNYGSDKNFNSENWGFLHGTSVKLIKSTLQTTNNIPIEIAQFITTACKYFDWPGLKIERTTIPGRFREQAYQFLKKYFEDKYGNYPLPIQYHWNASKPLNIQWITPKNRTMSSKPPTIYHIHGGAWALLHSCTYNHIFRDLTEASSSQIMSIEYRLAPQVPVLSQLEDVFAGYFYLMAPESDRGAGNKTSQIVVGGESAGGHFSSSLLHILRNANKPTPAGAYLMSPAVDLTFSQPSFFENSKRDYLWEREAPTRLDIKGQHFYSNLNNELYGQSPKKDVERIEKDGSIFGPKEILLWPEISPLFDTNMNNLPPTIVIVGDRDSLRDIGIFMES